MRRLALLLCILLAACGADNPPQRSDASTSSEEKMALRLFRGYEALADAPDEESARDAATGVGNLENDAMHAHLDVEAAPLTQQEQLRFASWLRAVRLGGNRKLRAEIELMKRLRDRSKTELARLVFEMLLKEHRERGKD